MLNRITRMNRRGFSLLELMTVVAITAILAVLAAPKISRSLKNAQARECEATRVIVTRAEQRYAGENEGKHSKGIEDLFKAGYLQTLPRCTGGGTYAWVPEINGVKGERRVICSVHGDALPDNPANVPSFPTPVKPVAQAPAPSAGTTAPTILTPVKPPKSAADCPPGMDYLPRAYMFATKTYSPVCAPKCPYGQVRRSNMLVDSCITPTCAPGRRWDPAALNCVPK